MNRILFSILVAVFAVSANDEGHRGAFGFDGSYIADRATSQIPGVLIDGFSTTSGVSTNTIYSREFEIEPRISFMPSHIVELAPSVAFGSGSSTQEVMNISNEVTDYAKTRQGFFGFHFGTYFHVIRTTYFHLSMGPKLGLNFYGDPKEEKDSLGSIVKIDPDQIYQVYRDNTFIARVPLNCDFHIGKTFGIRLSFELLSESVRKRTYLYKNDKNENITVTNSFSILGSQLGIEGETFSTSNALPSLGIFWRF